MGIAYRKFEPTEYVMKVKRGKIVQKGLGLSFFYNTMTTSMTVIPATAFDTGFTFDELMTADFQSVSVQGDISYIITNYERASQMVDFSWKGKKEYAAALTEARQKMSRRVLNLVKVCIAKFISGRTVREAIISADELAGVLRERMKEDEGLRDLGLELVSVSILGVLARSDTRKALEAAAREEILKQQDDAIYKRRNAAVEQERIVKENELNTEIRVAEKQKEKREKEMEMNRLVQEKQAELDARKLASEIRLEEENCRLVDLQTENEKKKSDARAYDSEALLKTFSGVDKEIIKALAISGMDSRSLIARAFLEMGDKAGKIGMLNVSPDLLSALTDVPEDSTDISDRRAAPGRRN